ncbi:AAA family ATPase [Treponema sp. R6D11]
MIVEFTVENYRSFKEKRTFSLISTKDKELSESNTFKVNKNLHLLKSAVLYGANASGKSNFFEALVFFLRFSVLSGPHNQTEDPIDTEPFTLSKQTESAPSSFEIVFIIKDESNETRYRYGFSVNNEHVETEYLFAIYNVREVSLFSRNLQDINCTPYFKEGTRGKASVRNNSSFLSVCAQNNGEIASQIVKYFRNMCVLFGAYIFPIFLNKNNKRYENKKKILDFLKYADIQITNFKTEDVPAFSGINDPDILALYKKKYPNEQGQKLLFAHTIYNNEEPIGEKYFDADMESAGTLKLFSYSDAVLDALDNGTPLFIDEFDTMLHPLIIEGIVKLFNSPVTNQKNAQLIISCHAVNIMTNKLFRRDQIWFCEKDQYGATDLYSLVEYKEPVRKDASYNKNYLHGKYGAIPYIDEILLQAGLKKQ